MKKDQLDALIAEIFGTEPAMTGSGLQFSRDGAFRLRDAILAAPPQQANCAHAGDDGIRYDDPEAYEFDYCPLCGVRLTEFHAEDFVAAPPVPPSDPEPTNDICFECGCEIRDDYGFAIPTDIGAHSQDITESPICAICWCRSWRPCPHHGDLCDAQRRYGPRIAVPEPEPSPQITREWINEKMNEVAACVRGGVSLSWADGWAACREQVLSGIESARAAAPEPPTLESES
jgi:hypothetical protein